MVAEKKFGRYRIMGIRKNSMTMNSCILFRLWVLGCLIFTAAVNERECVLQNLDTFSFPKFSLSTKKRVATYVINACKRFPHNVEKRFFFNHVC
jgi:hypothetical protein